MSLTDNHVESVCQPGKPGRTCSYLMRSRGWECAKGTRFEDYIKQRRAAGNIAMGDNCQGPPDFAPMAEPDPDNRNDDGLTVE